MKYRNIDTNEIWTEEEIRETFECEAELYEAYESFEDYMEYLLNLGRQGTGGVVEAETTKKIDIVRLTVETKEMPEDLERFCIDNLEDAGTEVLETLDWSEEALKDVKRRLPKSEIRSMGNYNLITAYVVEIYEADEDGEFVEGSDYDW